VLQVLSVVKLAVMSVWRRWRLGWVESGACTGQQSKTEARAIRASPRPVVRVCSCMAGACCGVLECGHVAVVGADGGLGCPWAGHARVGGRWGSARTSQSKCRADHSHRPAAGCLCDCA